MSAKREKRGADFGELILTIEEVRKRRRLKKMADKS